MYSDDDDREYDARPKRMALPSGGPRPMSHYATGGVEFSDDEARYRQVDGDGNEMESDGDERRFESRPKQSTTTRRRKPSAKRAAAPAARRPPVSTKRPVSVAMGHPDVSQARMAAMNPVRAQPVPISQPAHTFSIAELISGEALEGVGAPAADDHQYYGADGAEQAVGVPLGPVPVPALSPELEKLHRLYPLDPDKEHKCFACIHARSSVVNAVSIDRIKEIGEIIGGVPPACWVEVAVDIHEYYKREFLEELNSRLKPGEQPFPEWDVDTIYRHYFTPDHNKADVQLSTHSRTTKLDKIFNALYDYQTWTKTTMPDGTVVYGVDTTHLDLMLRISKTIDSMYGRTVTGKSGIGSVAQTNLTKAPGVVGGLEQYAHPRGMSMGRRK